MKEAIKTLQREIEYTEGQIETFEKVREESLAHAEMVGARAQAERERVEELRHALSKLTTT